MRSLEEIILGCKKGERVSQKALYGRYKSVTYSICKRYLKNDETAEDILQDGWLQIFTKIEQYRGQGSFEGWMKRIMVNQCLMHLRKANNFNVSLEKTQIEPVYDQAILEKIIYDETISYLSLLPTGYRTIFNLYVIEGYKHREIAVLLKISINTSKSQLILAKKRLREILKKKEINSVG